MKPNPYFITILFALSMFSIGATAQVLEFANFHVENPCMQHDGYECMSFYLDIQMPVKMKDKKVLTLIQKGILKRFSIQIENENSQLPITATSLSEILANSTIRYYGDYFPEIEIGKIGYSDKDDEYNYASELYYCTMLCNTEDLYTIYGEIEGSHPEHFVVETGKRFCMTFDAKTGKRLQWTDLFEEVHIPAVGKLVCDSILSSGQSFWTDDELQSNHFYEEGSVCSTDIGLAILFDSGQVNFKRCKPLAIILPYSQIKQYLKPRWRHLCLTNDYNDINTNMTIIKSFITTIDSFNYEAHCY